MSGQLVGEVIAASDSLRARGLSERGFHALIAIAEKAGTESRQGSVRWDHIRAVLYGASQRTAERAIADLKNAGLIRVVRVGFNNNHGRAAAPIYEIQQTTDSATQVSASLADDTDTQMAESTRTDADTQMAESPDTHTDTHEANARYRQNGDRYRQNGDRYRHPDVVLDVSIDGSIDEKKGLRFRGTSPGGGSCAPTAGGYDIADMTIECPHCHAPAHHPCKQETGEPKQLPCMRRWRSERVAAI
ncbi:hypothetical protein TS71_23035 [Mycolicibacterium neoaurum]|uniref:Uncharacterized protein n=1 Tax=Mycolicibacterium neoaurum VKM Ac-1815D TaxID=700508 RepID=V5XJI7_MYCNE|nr:MULTISPECIES: hypothetical protein [Mycobacteriaceae]AHC28021.1 hypothetical protein D174_19415 [Mycolicibacterium neoaurum VKM Ac-1815D]AMO06925.1 hypothetical protein MyAD_19045 [Mycolicibacterium neoaurum]KJQ48101.1 hypothetical protein TS71_23035 [Mycolicibacterium neoaurum]KUM06136.1 hypothetical protein AVZ31_22905 [Mycolicibacterium neoaurum]